MTRVSICCAYYNRAETINSTLDSLLAQTHQDLEIIVINDGSRDPQVKEILSTYSDPRLRVIHQENMTFVPTIRRAVAEATGDYIAIQGAGDISFPERIARQAAVLDANLDVGIVSCRHQELRIGGPKAGQTGLSRLISTAPDGEVLAGKYTPIIHGEVMFRKALYDKVGGYRTLFTFAQDRDLWLRMVEHAGIRVLEDILYQRNHFAHDGVNAIPEKVVQQRALTLFAIQCYHDRKIGGRDLIDRYGPAGFGFRRRYPELAGFMARRSKEAFLVGDMDVALRLSKLAVEEARTRETLGVAAMVRLGASKDSYNRAIHSGVKWKNNVKSLLRPVKRLVMRKGSLPQ
jgi:glycosyltransferase involved in cell wall biosynthesis